MREYEKENTLGFKFSEKSNRFLSSQFSERERTSTLQVHAIGIYEEYFMNLVIFHNFCIMNIELNSNILPRRVLIFYA